MQPGKGTSIVQLSDTVVIVTGGGMGIGKTYAEALARNGATVVVADIVTDAADRVADALRAEGFDALGLHVDVTHEGSTRAMVATAVERYGKVDVLLNNAALYSGILPKKFFDDISVDEWDRVMTVNTRGVFLCIKAVFPHMKARSRGKIINISSATALSGAPGFVHYVASKAAVLGMTRSFARELGQFGITVNAIAPGLTASDTTQALVPDDDSQRQVQARALKRVELPDDIVGAVLFLAGPGSDFVTGQTLVVDGGGIMH